MVGFRKLTAPLLTGNTQVSALGLPSFSTYTPSFGYGFRPGSTIGGNITMGPLGGIDPSIFANYSPSYVPPPPPPPAPAPKTSGGGGGGGGFTPTSPKDYYGDSMNSNDQEGYGDQGNGGGGPSSKAGGYGGSKSSSGAGSGSTAGSKQGGPGSWSTGGTIPPMYAQEGVDTEKKLREQGLLGTLGAADTANKVITGNSFFDPVVSLALGAYNLGSAIKEQGFYDGITPDILEPARDTAVEFIKDIFGFKDDKPEITPVDTTIPGYYGTIPGDYSPPKTSGITKDYTDTSTSRAFDYSPGNINPSTGQTMTPQTDTIPGNYSPPSVNISLNEITADNFTDPSTTFFADLQAAFAEFNTQFEAEQEAKRQADIDAANAAAAAANANSGSFNKGEYDAAGGWGPGVGGYNDPGAFGGSMGSSPGDKSTW